MKSYHHGDLRHALIEEGIEMINEVGEEALSLRKVAAKCGVSNAAPYAHFKNKDEFLVAIQQYIMDTFAATLEKTVEKYTDSEALLPMLGKAYVMFFMKIRLITIFCFHGKIFGYSCPLRIPMRERTVHLLFYKKLQCPYFKKQICRKK